MTRESLGRNGDRISVGANGEESAKTDPILKERLTKADEQQLELRTVLGGLGKMMDRNKTVSTCSGS